MKEPNKGSVLFKGNPEDFIVEEIGEKYVCPVSNSPKILENTGADFERLNLEDRKTFLTCDLEKINIDHFSAISIVSKAIGKQAHEIGYAGTKDKSAWTCQRISIFNPDIELLKKFSHPGILLKNFKWAKHKIKIGDLKGNRFRVVLRDADKDAIKILNKVRNSENVPNFFGMQRFGSLRKDNVIIGKLILKQKFEEAIFAYLTGFGDNESLEVAKAKSRLKSEKNILEARNYFPRELKTECQILDYLLESKDDWLGSLMILGEKVLTIMCQSVQSKLFNDILQRAIDEDVIEYGDNLPLPGYDFQFSSGRLGKIESDVLKSNNLSLENFMIPQMPFLSMRTSKRKAFFRVSELDVETEADELFPESKKIVLKFVLDSGVYATTFLEQFFIFR